MQRYKIVLSTLIVSCTIFTGATLRAAQDVTPPGGVNNLTAGPLSSVSVKLTWTAPGDDGATGKAESYDVRFRAEPITERNFASSNPVSGEPSPHSASSTEQMIVSGLTPNTTYWFALRTTDDAGNTSPVSNSVSTTTLVDTIAPNISTIVVSNITTTSAKINWSTNESASSLVRYGLNTSYSSSTASSTLVMTHSVPLAGLAPSTLYHFSVSSSDVFGNTATSTDRTFMTLGTSTPSTTIQAMAQISPSSINTKKPTKRIQVVVRLPKGTTFEGFDPESIRLNGVVKPVDTDLRPAVWKRWGKYRRTLIAKFKTEDIMPLIPAGVETFTLTITGNMKAGTFVATDSIKLVPKSKKAEKEIEKIQERLEDARERMNERQEELQERLKKQEDRLKERIEDLNDR